MIASLRSSTTRVVNNNTVVQEEKDGFAAELLPQTYNEETLSTSTANIIRMMSVEEVIS